MLYCLKKSISPNAYKYAQRVNNRHRLNFPLNTTNVANDEALTHLVTANKAQYLLPMLHDR